MKRLGFYVVAAALVAILIAMLLPAFIGGRPHEGVSRVNVEMHNFIGAMRSYETTFGTYPSGSNSEILRALQGDNPRNIILFEASTNAINVKGELVDPWGTPYVIELVNQTNFVIQSAGPNCQLGDSDDYVVDGTKGSFLWK